jgi:hypothetical protein
MVCNESIAFRPAGSTLVRAKPLKTSKVVASATGGAGLFAALFGQDKAPSASSPAAASTPSAAPAAAPATAPASAPAAAPSPGVRFYFLDSAQLRAFGGQTMPHFQELLRSHPGLLVPRVISFSDACKATFVGEILTVSQCVCWSRCGSLRVGTISPCQLSLASCALLYCADADFDGSAVLSQSMDAGP